MRLCTAPRVCTLVLFIVEREAVSLINSKVCYLKLSIRCTNHAQFTACKSFTRDVRTSYPGRSSTQGREYSYHANLP